MQRALQSIEQMLTELQGMATRQQCLPQDEFTAPPFQRTDYREQPAPSAVYFCLTSASALLDVSRSLLGQLDVSPTEGHWLGWAKLSALSKAAGQSAFMASIMLADPETRRAASAHHEDTWAATQVCPTPARAARPCRASVGTRLKMTLRSLIHPIAA
ncbi:hypothetical protein [Variovorax sp. JS1663]|uniref:hypothetical protein n=1 Tax=Variovorax sp. JS1663 TaxID=1851577 RepID=UPI00117EE0B4|nr:hypothetical protein [Variovorax sp. JS1663]